LDVEKPKPAAQATALCIQLSVLRDQLYLSFYAHNSSSTTLKTTFIDQLHYNRSQDEISSLVAALLLSKFFSGSFPDHHCLMIFFAISTVCFSATGRQGKSAPTLPPVASITLLGAANIQSQPAIIVVIQIPSCMLVFHQRHLIRKHNTILST
jgi:hypothetical protein